MALEDLKIRFQTLADRVDAMSLRERGLIFVTVLVVLYFVTAHLLFGPVNGEKDRLQRQIDQKREQIRLMDAQIQGALGDGHGTDNPKREKLVSLQESAKALDASLAQATSGLVPPKEMARLIEQVLPKNRGLQVVKVESLPAAPLLEGGAGSGGAGAMVYKHGMRIELKGSYLDILRYLRSLEGLPWKVFWGQATLKTDMYPVSRIDLVIYTLSTHEAWMGL